MGEILTDVQHHSGAEGHAVLGGVEYWISDWQLTETSVKQEVTTTKDFKADEGVSYRRQLTTQRSANGQFTMPRNSLRDFTGGNILSGQEVPLVLKLDNDRTYNFPAVLIGDIQVQGNGMTGAQTVVIPWESQSIYTRS